MIIREFGVRHAGRALSRPVGQACVRMRTLSTQPTGPTATTMMTPAMMQPDGSSGALQTQPQGQTARPIAAVFSANVKGTRRRKSNEVDMTGELYEQGQHLKSRIGRLGTKVEKRYHPNNVFDNPPGPKDVTLELLMASQAHMGHHTSLWNPANARYIYGIRQNIHIFSLEIIAAHLRRAARVVEEVAYRGGLILFVGTRKGHMPIVTQAAKLADACQLFTKWTPGSITNSEVILTGMDIQMLDEHDEPIIGFERHLNDRRPLVPDLVVCLNPMENFPLLHECALTNVPTIGVIDTNAEPTWVTYVIPANDDSLRCLAVIGSVLGRAGEEGKRRRLHDAKSGVVEWTTPVDVQKFITVSRRLAEREAEKARAMAGEIEEQVEGAGEKSKTPTDMPNSVDAAGDNDPELSAALKRFEQ